MHEVKELEVARDQGIREIIKLQKNLYEALNEVAILKKVVGKGSIGGLSHITIKELIHTMEKGAQDSWKCFM